MQPIQMAKYNLKSAIDKITRVVGSGRAANYFNKAKELFKGGSALYRDVKNDYSNPSMGRRKRKGKRSTPKMGRRRRRR